MFKDTGLSYTYYFSKFSGLIYELLIHQDDAKRRLLDNELLIRYILTFDVPDQIKPIKKRIIENLINEKIDDPNELNEINEFKFLLINKRKSTAAKIIKDLNSLFISMKEYEEQSDM